jgi:hypothetical protein
MSERDPRAKPAHVWAEHTVVANLPRHFPSSLERYAPLSEVEEPRTLIGMPRPVPPPTAARELGVPLCEVEEPRTVVGEAPSRATAQQLLARYAALSAALPPAAPQPAETALLPSQKGWFRRVISFAQEDFRRAPRMARLLLPALPLLAAATTFLDVDPAAPALSRAVAAAATGGPVASTPAPSPSAAALAPALPVSSVAIVRHAGRTLAAEAADAAARGDRGQAIAIYTQLAREHPEDVVYASAARILMRDEERNRPHLGQ